MDALRSTEGGDASPNSTNENTPLRSVSLLKLAQSTKQHTPLSGIFLVLGLSFFLLSSITMILMVGAQSGGAKLAWSVAFLPLWVGDGLTVVCLVGAMISACCSIVQGSNTLRNGDDNPDPSSVLQKNRELVAQGPSHVNHIKHVLTSGFCCPFMCLPPLPILGLLFGFHINCWRYLSNSSGTSGTSGTTSGTGQMSLFSMFIPLYIVMGIVTVPYFVCRANALTFAVMASVIATIVLIPYKIEAKAEELKWTVVFLPLLLCFSLIFLQVLYVIVNDLMWEYRQRLRMQTTVQRWSILGYLIGVALLIAGGASVASHLDQGSSASNTSEGLLRVLPLFAGCFMCVVSGLCIASVQARDYIFNQGSNPVPDTEEGKLKRK